MSKKNKLSDLPKATGPSLGGYMYYPHEMQHLEGRIFTTVESFGMRESQEKAAKDMLRFHLQEFWSKVKYVSADEADEITRRHYSQLENGNAQSTSR